MKSKRVNALLITAWQERIGITDWEILSEKISPGQIIYDGEHYFIGIVIDKKQKLAIIYHDIELNDNSICHELLHVKYPECDYPEYCFDEYEEYIQALTDNIIKWQIFNTTDINAQAKWMKRN